MLKIKEFGLRFKDKKIFEKANLEVGKGEIVVITGQSGCGKSSLLKAINGIILETEDVEVKGAIEYKGKSILEESIVTRSKFISTVFQNPKTQFYCINTTDELAFALENRSIPREEILETIREYTMKLQTSHVLNKNIFTLSGGEKQLVAITGVTCMNNEIYLFDEPSASLDKKAIEGLKKILLELKSMGKIILIAEHRLYYLADIMDKLVIMHKKEIKVLHEGSLLLNHLNIISEQYGLRTFTEMTKSKLYHLPYYKIKLCANMDYKKSLESLNCNCFQVCYKQNQILDMSISFPIGINFIIGENGVGKTSFIRKLCGLLKGKGTSFWQGCEMKQHYRFVSLVMQDVNYQLFTESVWQELSIVSSDDVAKEEALQELNLYDKKDLHPQILSGGEKQRLVIGLAKLSDKPIIVLDEPTSGLCKGKMLQLIDYLYEMKAQKKVIIVITHDYELIHQCGGNIYEFVR